MAAEKGVTRVINRMETLDPLPLILSRREREPFNGGAQWRVAVEAQPSHRSAGGSFEGILSLRERNKVRGSD